MNEFLKLEWKTDDITKLEPQKCFITEESLAGSIVYKALEKKGYLYSKTKNNKSLIFKDAAYIPGQSLYIPTFIKSTLNTWYHEHCLTALKLLQSGKDPSTYSITQQFSVEKYNSTKHKIHVENSKYQTYVQARWEKDKKKLLDITNRIFSYGQLKWDKNCSEAFNYPQYYKEFAQFNITPNESECTIDFKCVSNLLEVGTLAKFSHPNLKSQCTLTCLTLPPLQQNVTINSKLRVSKDENIRSLLQSHSDIQIVIAMSSLRCFADNSDLKNTWMIPFIVKEIEVKQENGNTSKKHVAFIDKVFPQTNVTKLDWAQLSFKYLVRSNLCQFEAFRYEGKDIPINDNVKQPDDVNENTVSSQNLVPQKSSSYGKNHHNASYRIWNIKKTGCQNNLMKNKIKPVEINVLVRSKLDGCEFTDEGVLQPVMLTPKLERQIHYGANIPSKSQLVKEWSSLFFTPFSILYRVRVAPTVSEVVAVEKCTLQKVMSEAQIHYDFKPNLGLCRIQKVFEEITKLEPGNYLIQHLPKHEAFVCILKECTASEKTSSFDLHNEFIKNPNVSNYPKNWLPIDVNFILPTFEANQRMPAMFTPPCERNNKAKGAKKKKKKKGKKKGTTIKETVSNIL